jgi:hypothetical protein
MALSAYSPAFRFSPPCRSGAAGDAAGTGGVAVTPAGRCNAKAVGTPSRPVKQQVTRED